MLPYTELEKVKVDGVSITGKSLNINPKKLFANDKYILAPLQKFYDEIPELDGSNIDGLIEHIKILKSKIDIIKSTDEEIIYNKMDFLKKNDCNVYLRDLFPCYDITKEEVLSYFDNTTIQAYEDDLQTCEDCEDHIDCDL